MTASPEISVIVPAFNAAWCVGRALDSVLAQTRQPAQIVVVDDGSTDATAALLAGYGRRIEVIRQANAGMSAARNTGLRAARGELVAFLDADDWWRPRKLEVQVELLGRHPEIGFCSVAADLQGPGGEALGTWRCAGAEGDLVERLLAGEAVVAGGASSVMARASLLGAAGPFDPSLRGAEDADFWVRLAALAPYACIPEPLVVVTRNPASVSSNRDAMLEGALRMLRKHRRLLGRRSPGAWRYCHASVLTDYAKWEYRDGLRGRAMLRLAQAALRSPLGRGRLALGLLVAMALGRPL